MRQAFVLDEKSSADQSVQLEEPPTVFSVMEKPDQAESIRAHTSRH